MCKKNTPDEEVNWIPKARKRKDTQFNNKMSKCVFLYGEPTNDKAAKIRKIQTEFVRLINNYLNDPTRLTSDGDSTGWRP